jgi:hypothetical protein
MTSRLPRLSRIVPLVAALSVIVVGAAYLGLRSRSWESTAELAVTPTAHSVDAKANLLGNLQESGTLGTRVELISSKDTLAAAGNPEVQISVRSIPDTRVIDVTATGALGAVRPGLSAVLSAAIAEDTKLDDPWQMKTIASPTPPAKAGPGNAELGVAVAVLALLAALASYAGLRRLEGDPGSSRPGIVPPPAELPRLDWREEERTAGRR